MSSAEQTDLRLSQLLRRLCDETLNDDEAVELNESLATSESARRRYVETMQLCNDLADWSQATGAVSIPYSIAAKGVNGKGAKRKALDTERDELRRKARSGSELFRVGRFYLRPSWLGWGAAAAMLLAVTVSIWSYFNHQGLFKSSEAGPSAAIAQTDNDRREDRQRNGQTTKFVARVVEITSDARWDDELHPREFLMRLREGDELRLMSGLAHLEFYSGARIILQGPSKFTPTGPAGGKLESGRLTGKVDGGKFQLTTPTAKVIDLGTEFGVTVGPSTDTDVCVFDGEVEVRPDSGGKSQRRSISEAYSLTQGMSVRVAATGKVSDGLYAGVDYDVYNRTFPLPTDLNPGELDLVDIVCGGNGQGMRLAAAIDPLTGQWDRRPWSTALGPGTRKGDGLFHRADWHPFIDGTFVPNKTGDPTQVDTRGGTIRLPKNFGDYTWGPIWARRAVKDSTHFDRAADSWGTKTYPVITERLSHCRLGGIGIHASVGITFDLTAIGKEHPGQITRLQGILANLENSKEHNPEWANSNPPPSADYRVFVDGKLRYEKLNFARNVEGVPFTVELSPKDRFLTFVTNDAGNSNRYDHIVVIDPVLEIRNSDKTQPARVAVPVLIQSAN
jgi:hypothetical protein